MDQNEILEKVKLIIQNQIVKKRMPLAFDTLLNDIEGWDSLKHVMAVAEVEQAFKVKIDFLELLELKTIGDICQVVAQHQMKA